eukprot:jgi/Tetstr1/454343/TSEL_004021.t1
MARSDPPPGEFFQGLIVRIKGLTSSPQYNGVQGLVAAPVAGGRVPVCVLDVPSNPKAAPFVLKVMPSNLEQCMAEMRAFADSEARPSDGDARVRLGMARLASGNFRRTVFDLSAAASMGNCSDKPRLQAEL